MAHKSTRRAFLKELSAAALVRGGPARGPTEQAVATPWTRPPKLDGELLFDEASRREAATDLGGHFYRLPAAVLKPRSVDDIRRIVRFANERGLKVVMRGRGHSQYGQALAERGIVIDSRTLDAVSLKAQSVDVQAGASWDDVLKVTLARGFTPPAMGDTMTLSVGGILSAGGISNSSHLYGGVVDHVEALDVVTGSGDMVRCSADRNRELFELALGGMGQCALIVNARLRLIDAPKSVVRRDLIYDDLGAFLSDATRLASEARVDHLGTYLEPVDDGRRWRFTINIGKFTTSDRTDFARIERDLRFVSRTDPVTAPYAGYLHREAARNAAADAARLRTPSRLLFLMMFIPSDGADQLLGRILDTPAESGGLTRFSANPFPTRLFTRPMFVLPPSDVVLVLYLFKSVPVVDERAYETGMATVRRLIDRMRAAGGNAYPPNAPFFSAGDWRAHYGPTRWQRLQAGKNRFDPRAVLTPGGGMFSSRPPSR